MGDKQSIGEHRSMPAATPLACLRASPLLTDVTDEGLAALAESGRALHLTSGQQLFAEGEPADSFHVIVEGQVELYRVSLQGDEKLFQILEAGDLLAEAAMFLEPPRYPLTARACTDVRLFAFPRRNLLALCDACPQVTRSLVGALAKRLYQAVNRIEHLSLNNAGQRLVAYLLELRRHQAGQWIAMPVNIDLPVNIAVLAGQLAMTPETLSRLLQRFRREGLISGKGRMVVLLDAAALCKRVGLPYSEVPESGMTPPMVGCCNLR